MFGSQPVRRLRTGHERNTTENLKLRHEVNLSYELPQF
jgi:hypothetical protein